MGRSCEVAVCSTQNITTNAMDILYGLIRVVDALEEHVLVNSYTSTTNGREGEKDDERYKKSDQRDGQSSNSHVVNCGEEAYIHIINTVGVV